MKYSSRKGGFTLVELLVTIAIIAILSAIVIVNVAGARERARDTKRIADMGQIELALTLYKEVNGYYPRESDDANGEVGEGAGLDTMIAPFLDSVPYDPLGPDDDDYYYYYDGNQACGGENNQAVIAVHMMENDANSNADDTICSSWGGEGGIGAEGSYMIVLGESDG